MALLEVDAIHTYYGNIHALKGVSLAVEQGEIVTLIGGNGAGKTTTLNTISGILRPRTGTVRLDGNDLATVAPHSIVALGVVQVPEGRRMFARLTVEENLKMGGYTVSKQDVDEGVARAYEMFPRLKERRVNLGNQLSGGEQQMLAVARALVLNPKLMLLDEPTEGLAPIIIEELLAALKRIIRDEGMSAIVVEQHAQKILGVTDSALILDRGTIVHASSSKALIEDPTALEQHLGVTAKKKPMRSASH
jgi:branched-chain amino acid transport system ATP-binding protein